MPLSHSMNVERERHLERILDASEGLISDKFRRGQAEHGGNIWEKPGMLQHALDESADMSTACHAIHDAASLDNPNVVKVVLDARGHALYFSRSRIPYPREAGAACYRHAGIYGYRVAFLRDFSKLEVSPLEKSEALEQLRALWHGFRIAVAVSEEDIPPGVDTPQDLEAVRRILTP